MQLSIPIAYIYMQLFMQVLNGFHLGVAQLKPTYGRKTMQGLLAATGVRASHRRVAKTLRTVAPGYHHAKRACTARQTNPAPYSAEYYGHKLHLDQNEKLVMHARSYALRCH